MDRYKRFVQLAAPLLVGLLVACGPSQPNTTTPILNTVTTAPVTSAQISSDPGTPSPRMSLPGTATRTQTTPAALASAPVRTPPASPAVPFALSPTQPASCFAAGFSAPDPRTFAEMLPVVLEYLYYRKRAVISGETREFLDRYPALREGANAASGVNDEARMIAIFKQAFTLIDGDIDPEHYERMKVRRDGASVEVIIHMLETYLRRGFSITGGESRLKLSLQQSADTWTLVRTDALTDGELARERQCH